MLTTKYSGVLNEVGIPKTKIEKESGVDDMKQNNDVEINEIKGRINLLVNMIAGKIDDSLDDIRKAIDEPTSANIAAAIEKANSLKAKNVPYIDNIVSSFEQLKEVTKVEEKEEIIDVDNIEESLADLVASLEADNHYSENQVDIVPMENAIIDALTSHQAGVFVNAINEVEKLQKLGVPNTNEIVS